MIIDIIKLKRRQNHVPRGKKSPIAELRAAALQQIVWDETRSLRDRRIAKTNLRRLSPQFKGPPELK